MSATRSLSDVLSSGGGGAHAAAFLGSALLSAAQDGEVWTETATSDRRGWVRPGSRVGCGLKSDPVLSVAHTLLDVYAGRVLRLSPDPLLYERQLGVALARAFVPERSARTGALVTLLRRMASFHPEGRPSLGECALVWGRCVDEAAQGMGRERWAAAFDSRPHPWPEGIREVRGWSDADAERVAAAGRVGHPVLRRVVRVADRGDGVTALVLEALPAEPLENLLGGPLTSRLRYLGVALKVVEAVAALHEAGVFHGGVVSRNVLVDGDRVALDGLQVADRSPLPSVTGDGPFAADRWGLGALLREVLTGDVRRIERRPDRVARYTLDLQAEAPAARLPASRTVGRLAELARAAEAGSLELPALAARLGAEVERVRASFAAHLAEAPLPALVLPEP